LQYANKGTDLTLGGAVSKYDGNHFGKIVWALNGIPEPNKTWYDHDAVKKDFNVYTKWKQIIDKNLQFFIDLQLRKVDYNINGFRDNPTVTVDKQYNFFNPKAGLTYHNNNWTAFASYSIGNKEPNRDDFEASVLEQPKPERLHDVEVGLEKKSRDYNIGANLYYMKYDDQLVLTGKINDVGAYTRTNIDDSYRLGIELQAGVTITNWLKASGNLTLSKNRIKNFNEFIDDYDNGGQKINSYNETDISFSPSILGSAIVTITPIKKLNLDLVSKYVGKQYLDNTNNEARQLNAFYTQDVRASYSLSKGWIKNTELIFQVNNVFNKKYEPNGYTFSYYYNSQLTTENYYFPMAGRNFMISVNFKF
jgi:iron complex outermembrane receptor protein